MKKLLVAALVSLMAFTSSGASAQQIEHLYVSGPGGAFTTYTVPLIVITQGDTITYRNIDIAAHDVRATVFGPDRAWCMQFPFNFPSGKCPLFTSRLIGLSGTSPVYGIPDLVVPPSETAKTYEFFCSIHPNMKGTLVVVKRPLT
ncbi:MAG TPA: hypothetical protein VM841_05240 [Actinomycetota bacterium]|nr:hypothetical protein [Actinomycetota bacterium]